MDYQIFIFNGIIKQTSSALVSVSIPFEDITEINKTPSGNILIKTRQNARAMGISRHIENKEVLLKELAKIHPISDSEDPKLIPWEIWLVTGLVAGSMITIFTVENSFVIIGLGLAISAFLIWSRIKIQKSKAPRPNKSLSSILFLSFNHNNT